MVSLGPWYGFVAVEMSLTDIIMPDVLHDEPQSYPVVAGEQECTMDEKQAAGIQYHDVTAAAFRIRRHGGIKETPLEV